MERPREMKVLALGLPRTGTLSMARALSLLGYENVHHTLENANEKNWRFLSRAADASFPVLPTYTGRPFTRADWDELYGPCEAVTECAALFPQQLLDVYPDAKVILVVRDFDKWYKSFDETLIVGLWSPLAHFFTNLVHPLIGVTSVRTIRKLVLGFLDARTPDLGRKNARRVYDEHHARIMQRVPDDKLLVYRLGEGWGPICKFLDKPVPAQDFPWINEAAELKKATGERLKAQLEQAACVVLIWGLGATCLGILCWHMF